MPTSEGVEGLEGLEIVEATPLPLGEEPPVEVAKAAGSTHACLGATAVAGAEGCFQPYGDVIWVHDTKSDGRSAAVGVTTDYGRAGYVCIHSGGAGTWGTCNKNYKETGNVKLQVATYEKPTGRYFQPLAYSGWIPVDGQ
ncbi:hypothetical protein [Streptomyces tsukubensis]|uniref:hypothetical protein n=1 Tax=Streptomyces tsukubensis TaxID=83656 RepID=UPI00277B4ABD|nr:hypothetical protein [Streptomyces tsukubensis]